MGVPYKLGAAFSPWSYNHKEMNSAENLRQPASGVFSLEHSDGTQPRSTPSLQLGETPKQRAGFVIPKTLATEMVKS